MFISEAKYDGSWVGGRPEGQGKIICADGREYVGHFRDGLCDGYAELTRFVWPVQQHSPFCLLFSFSCHRSPMSVGSVKSVHGSWHAGKVHGFARVEYYEGSRYVGDWLMGVRHGHGRFVRYSINERKRRGEKEKRERRRKNGCT